MQPTLRQLQHFIALAETGQVSRAALRCHVSQSAMTASLQGLERVVGVSLFIRQAAGVRLTTEGLRFLRSAQRVVSSMQDALDDVRTVPQAITGTLRIGLTETISAYLMPRLLPLLRRKFPALQIFCVERERQTIESALHAGHLDLALMLASNLSGDPALVSETLLRSPRQLWANPEHPLMQQERVSLADVTRQPYLLLDMDEHLTTVDRYWGHYHLRPMVSLQSRSIEAVRSLVAAGEGVTILSDLVYRPWSLEGQRLSRRPLTDEVPSMDVGIVWSRHQHDADQWMPLTSVLREMIG